MAECIGKLICCAEIKYYSIYYNNIISNLYFVKHARFCTHIDETGKLLNWNYKVSKNPKLPLARMDFAPTLPT